MRPTRTSSRGSSGLRPCISRTSISLPPREIIWRSWRDTAKRRTTTTRSLTSRTPIAAASSSRRGGGSREASTRRS
ncbi:hypothetical protein VTN02DRAFT_6406 [Thermoascus thermophilus]